MKRILVCEDEDVIREFVVINLKRAGYEVIDVNCGEEAVKAFDQQWRNFWCCTLSSTLWCQELTASLCASVCVNGAASRHILCFPQKLREMDKVSGLMIGADDYNKAVFTVRIGCKSWRNFIAVNEVKSSQMMYPTSSQGLCPQSEKPHNREK